MNDNPINLFSFAFVDISIFSATMTLKYGRHFADNDRPPRLALPPFQDTQHIVLRGPAADGDAWFDDVDQIDQPILKEWPSAQKLIEDIGSRITTQLSAPNLTFGKVYLESIRPGGHIGWHVDDTPYGIAHTRFRLLAAPCSGGCWFAGGDSLPPGVGNLTIFNHRTIHSAINLGPVPQISLVLDVRKPVLQ